MGSIAEKFLKISSDIPEEVTLVAVSKTHPEEAVMEVYNAGHRIFGESKAQELLPKYEALPKDIHWHMIGHLQSNKVKYIAPFVSLIHSIDSLKLLKTVNKEAAKNKRVIDCLLQMHIAEEDTKFGFSYDEILEVLESEAFKRMQNIRIVGMMCMATFTDNQDIVRKEFQLLNKYFRKIKSVYFVDQSYFKVKSMGMSDDYPLAIEEGSNMIRVGSSIFGYRDYKNP